ncbi:teicoplanin resistance protein VanZ [Marinobacter fuscus]|uniref:Teicoplanin resistance protein VanZ n=1 Tax=Marinobacter fuscus TaxID=2109942 RepID=A0A2T1K4Q3_9GAMM|nr:VanZ family protein [Marinobacter fuscus]PSF05146.1 teicoplanin resistance protein VanZ [Marinobacter fuscus]
MPRIRDLIINLLAKRRLWQAMVLVSVAAVLFLATTSNTYPVPASANDKINHVIAFLELTLVTRLAWPRLPALWYAPALLAFGFSLEVVQATLPYRDFALSDVAADALGIGLGLLPWPGIKTVVDAHLRKSPDNV